MKLGAMNDKTISTSVFKDPVAPHYIKYAKNCQVPKEGHLGQFPANFCVKLIGVSGECSSCESWKLDNKLKLDFL